MAAHKAKQISSRNVTPEKIIQGRATLIKCFNDHERK